MDDLQVDLSFRFKIVFGNLIFLFKEMFIFLKNRINICRIIKGDFECV